MSSNHFTAAPTTSSCAKSEREYALPPLVTCPVLQEAHPFPPAQADGLASASSTPRPSPRRSRISSSPPSTHSAQRSDSASPKSVECRTAASITDAETSFESFAASASPTPQVIVFDNTKAGLQSVDKKKTETLIKELSKNSSFYQNEERKAKNRQKHIDALLVKSRQYEATVKGRPDSLRDVQRKVAELEATIESHREFDHIYAHLDMDMFFAAVEMKKNPHYANLPLGIGDIGMLSTTNYVARQYGVRSGMPGFIGLHLCPKLIIVPTDFPAYRVESHKFKAVVRSYDPAAHGLGMDEIMMCLNHYLSLHSMDANTHDERFDAAEKIVEECRRRITEATGLTASAGIAPTPTLAKMVSNYKKPNGQSCVRLFTREAVMQFLAPIPVRQVPGIGKSQESILAGLGIHTLGDIYADRHRLHCILTRKTYEFLLCSALGVGGMYDGQEVITTTEVAGNEESDGECERKSVGHERTFRQLSNRGELQDIAYRNLNDAHQTLIKEHFLASQVVLKLKFRSFQVKQHSKTLNVYTDDVDVLRHALDEILIPVMDQFADFRLLGVRLEKLRQRAETDGEEGAASVPKIVGEAEIRQKKLSDFFNEQQPQQASIPRSRTEVQGGHKRCRNSDVNDVEEVDSEVEVLVVSSESQLADTEDAHIVATAPSLDEKGAVRQSVLSALERATKRKQGASVVDLSDDDTDQDDDVVFVE